MSVLHGYNAEDDESPGRDELHALQDGRGKAGVVVLKFDGEIDCIRFEFSIGDDVVGSGRVGIERSCEPT